MSTEPAPISPDTKDWTWVLQRPCPECAYDAAEVDLATIPARFEANAQAWGFRLRRADARTRPTPTVWSPLEYACHVRDVHWLFLERLTTMLEHDDPEFMNWDQDETAVDDAYASQQPAEVGRDLASAAAAAGAAYAGVSGAQWQRRGLRDNGSEFTVETLGLYHLHDIVHHAHDVGLDRREP